MVRTFHANFIPVWVSICTMVCAFPALGQLQQSPGDEIVQTIETDSSQAVGAPESGSQLVGTISGMVVDSSQAVMAGVPIRLTQDSQSRTQESVTDGGGQFWFNDVSPGRFELTISARNFASQTITGTLHPGEDYVTTQIVLTLATEITAVRVGLSSTEVAEEQLKLQESQRLLGFVPNFYVSYVPNAVPLNSKQKFALSLKYVIDPATFAVTGAAAGIRQTQDNLDEYGTGAAGYGKRYAASYADLVTGTFLGSAIFPSLLKQDPRYFYKGSGSVWSRTLYAMANAVICKGDNQHWQPNYSGIAGSLASGGISNLYYPSNRQGAGLVFENTAIGIAETAIQNVLQEFVLPKLTPHLSKPMNNPRHGAPQTP